jgi:transposase, IS30 family
MLRHELRTEAIPLLLQGQGKHCSRVHGDDIYSQTVNMVSVSQCPVDIEKCLVPGHWDGGIIKGKYNRSSVGILVERTTLFTLLAKMDGTSMKAALEGYRRVLNRVEAKKKLSITCDRSRETGPYKLFAEKTGISIYLADPHTPWRRKLNKKSGELLRQYLPESQNLSTYSQKDLDKIAWLLNSRPRESLGWDCPAELFIPNFDFVKYYSQFFSLLS